MSQIQTTLQGIFWATYHPLTSQASGSPRQLLSPQYVLSSLSLRITHHVMHHLGAPSVCLALQEWQRIQRLHVVDIHVLRPQGNVLPRRCDLRVSEHRRLLRRGNSCMEPLIMSRAVRQPTGQRHARQKEQFIQGQRGEREQGSSQKRQGCVCPAFKYAGVACGGKAARVGEGLRGCQGTWD